MTPTINLLVLRCKSIELTKEFYERLGLDFVQEKHGTGVVHFSTEINGMIMELYPSSEKFPVDTCRLGFSYPDITDLAKSFNCEVLNRDNVSYFIVQDADGRSIEILE